VWDTARTFRPACAKQLPSDLSGFFWFFLGFEDFGMICSMSGCILGMISSVRSQVREDDLVWGSLLFSGCCGQGVDPSIDKGSR